QLADDARSDAREPIAREAAHVRVLAQQILDQRVVVGRLLRMGWGLREIGSASDRNRTVVTAFAAAADQVVLVVAYCRVGIERAGRVQLPVEFVSPAKPANEPFPCKAD